MSESIEPYAIKIGGKTGIAPYQVRTERRLSDLREHFLDRNLVEDTLSREENPVIYEVYEIPQKPIDGSLNVGCTIMRSGKIGSEYYFTKGHYHNKEAASELYMGLKGEGIILMQNRKGEARDLKLKPNNAVYIPPGYAHRTVNVGSSQLVFLAIYPSDAGHNYESILETGFSRVVVEKDGRAVIKENPNYRGP